MNTDTCGRPTPVPFSPFLEISTLQKHFDRTAARRIVLASTAIGHLHGQAVMDAMAAPEAELRRQADRYMRPRLSLPAVLPFSLIYDWWCISPHLASVSFTAMRSRDHARPICLTLIITGRRMKDLLAVVSPVSELDWSVDYGVHLARLLGAHFTVLIADIDLEPQHHQMGPNGQHIAEPDRSTLAHSGVAEAAALIRVAAAHADVSCCVLSHDGASRSLRETVIVNAQVRDLVLLDVCGPLRYPRKGLVEAVLFNAGRPIVLVPPNVRCSEIRGALIAWDGTPSSVRALHDAMPLLAHVRDIVVVTVSGDKELRQLSPGDDLCRYLARWGFGARAETIERGARTVGVTLLEHARQIDADLLIMGGYAHPKERDFIFGSATRDIFQSTPDIPILLSH